MRSLPGARSHISASAVAQGSFCFINFEATQLVASPTSNPAQPAIIAITNQIMPHPFELVLGINSVSNSAQLKANAHIAMANTAVPAFVILLFRESSKNAIAKPAQAAVMMPKLMS